MPWTEESEDRKRHFADLVESTIRANETAGWTLDSILPRFIGHGNPMAKVLFIGQELALDVGTTVFIDEVLNNVRAWKHFIDSRPMDGTWIRDNRQVHEQIASQYRFSPLFPAAYYSERPKSGHHTWGRYSRILHGGAVDYEQLLKQSHDPGKSFGHFCFLTEWNCFPARNASQRKASQLKLSEAIGGNPVGLVARLQSERLNVLSHPYFKTFPLTFVCNGQLLPGMPGFRDLIRVLEFDAAPIVKELGGTRWVSISTAHRTLVVTWNAASIRRSRNAVFDRLWRDYVIPATQ